MRKTGIVILLLLPVLLHAEHLFEMGLQGGIAGWSGKTEYVDKRVGAQGGAHVYYDYFSPYVIGFRTGVTIDMHNASFGKTNYEYAYTIIDFDSIGDKRDVFLADLSQVNGIIKARIIREQ